MRDGEGHWQCVGVGVYHVNSLPNDPFWDQFDASYSKPLDLSWIYQLQTDLREHVVSTPERSQQDPFANTKPPCVPNGAGDVGAEAITPFFIGPKGGAQLDTKGIYPYFGLAAGTPGKGISVSGGPQMVTPGISVGFSAAFIVGFSYSSAPITQGGFMHALRGGSWQFGGGTPGFSGNVNVVLNSPGWLKRIWPCE